MLNDIFFSLLTIFSCHNCLILKAICTYWFLLRITETEIEPDDVLIIFGHFEGDTLYFFCFFNGLHHLPFYISINLHLLILHFDIEDKK